MLGTGNALWFSDGMENATPPPAERNRKSQSRGEHQQLDTQDRYSGGTNSDCADPTQAGVAEIEDYLESLSPPSIPTAREFSNRVRVIQNSSLRTYDGSRTAPPNYAANS